MVIGLTRPTSQAHVVPRESNYQKLLPPAIHIFRDQDPKNRMVAEGRIYPKKCNPVFKRNYQSVETSWTQESLKSSVIHCVGTTFVWPYVGSHTTVETIGTTYPTHFHRTKSGVMGETPPLWWGLLIDYYLPISFWPIFASIFHRGSPCSEYSLHIRVSRYLLRCFLKSFSRSGLT